MSANGNIVTIRNLSKIYQQGEINVTALDNVSLDIASHEFLTLMGPRLGQVHVAAHHRGH
jgi:ABC-type multidrug transport system ATPase subunit